MKEREADGIMIFDLRVDGMMGLREYKIILKGKAYCLLRKRPEGSKENNRGERSKERERARR